MVCRVSVEGFLYVFVFGLCSEPPSMGPFVEVFRRSRPKPAVSVRTGLNECLCVYVRVRVRELKETRPRLISEELSHEERRTAAALLFFF